MIKFFRQSYPVQYVFLALLAIVLWIPVFITGKADMALCSPVTPLYNLVSGLLDFSPYAMIVLAFLMMAFNAVFFNSILITNQIVAKVSTIGAFAFLLVMNFTLTQSNFYPFALACVFILMLMHTMFLIYQTQNPELYLLNAGIFVAIASMLYFPSIVMVVWVLISLFIARKSNIRLLIIPVIGFLFPYFLYFAGVYLFGNLPETAQQYADYFSSLRFAVEGFDWIRIVVLSVLTVLAVIPLISSSNFSFEKTIATRAKIMMTIVLLVFAVLLLFSGGEILYHGLIFVALSVIVSYDLSYMDKTGWADLLLTALMVLVIVNRYFYKVI